MLQGIVIVGECKRRVRKYPDGTTTEGSYIYSEETYDKKLEQLRVYCKGYGIKLSQWCSSPNINGTYDFHFTLGDEILSFTITHIKDLLLFMKQTFGYLKFDKVED